MAKVTIKGIANVQKRVKDTFEQIRKSEKLLIEIGEISVIDIVGNARSGRNPEDKSTFPALSDSWQSKREYLKKFNSVDNKFYLGSSKSNLTFTGQLLNSIGFRIVPARGSVTVSAKGTHKGYKPKGKSIENSKLVDYLEDKGFRFLSVSESLRKRINILTKRFIRRLIIKGEI